MSNPNNSRIEITAHATTCVGPDAVNLFAAVSLKVALGLYAETGIRANRHLTPTHMLALAKQYTGKTYKRGQYRAAADDVKVWCDTMRAALPASVDGVQQ